MAKNIIPDSIRDVLDYNPDTGDLTWTVQRGPTTAGTVVRSVIPSTGYYRLTYKGCSYLAHRVAYFISTGEQPDVVDHINRNKTDNRIANLRSVSKRINSINRGLSGISVTKDGYWRAQYCGRYLYKGKDLMTAHYRRIMAERQDHPIGLPWAK